MDKATSTAAGVAKALRTLAGMSQRELAEASGVAASTVGRVESGAIDPSLETIAKLAAGAELGGRVVKAMSEEQLREASAKLIPTRIMHTMCALTAMAAGDQVLADLGRTGGYQSGKPVHPSDGFGKVLAWLWLTDQALAIRTLADFCSQLRNHGHSPVLVTLDDVLAGLTFAMPPRFPDDEFEVLKDEARRTVPVLYGKPF